MRAGRNSLVLRVDCGEWQFVVKGYRPGPRDRQACEAAAISFLRDKGLQSVPALHKADTETGLSLLEFVAGAPVSTPGGRDLDQATAFALDLIDLSGAAETEALPTASAAVFSLQDLATQLAERRRGFAGKVLPKVVAELLRRHTDLGAQALQRAESEAEAVGWQASLPREKWVLSASDFGFHNAVRRPGGDLCFIDFEYFGWDDPVKMICDFCLHPGHDLPSGGAERFRGALLDRLGEADPAIRRRERLCRPLYALCWALIVMNDLRDATLDAKPTQVRIEKSETYISEAARLLADAAN